MIITEKNLFNLLQSVPHILFVLKYLYFFFCSMDQIRMNKDDEAASPNVARTPGSLKTRFELVKQDQKWRNPKAYSPLSLQSSEHVHCDVKIYWILHYTQLNSKMNNNLLICVEICVEIIIEICVEISVEICVEMILHKIKKKHV